MRTKPIGTGPFKFVEFKSNESVKLVRNPDYWKKGHPYLDGIDWRVISNRSTRALAFVAGEFDMTFSLDLTVAITKDVQSQLPKAICELQPTNNSFNLIVNREAPPFNNPQDPLRRWHWRSTARPSSTSSPTARARSAASCWPGPRAAGACRPRWSQRFPATAPTSRRAARRRARSWQGLGYGPGNPLKVKVVDAQHPALSRPRGAADRPAQADPRRGRARGHRHQRVVPQGRARGILGRHEPDRRRPSTTPTLTSTRATPAARSATTPSIAIPKSRS